MYKVTKRDLRYLIKRIGKRIYVVNRPPITEIILNKDDEQQNFWENVYKEIKEFIFFLDTSKYKKKEIVNLCFDHLLKYFSKYNHDFLYYINSGHRSAAIGRFYPNKLNLSTISKLFSESLK